MDKMIGTSMDICSENVRKLMDIFPNVVTEGKIDFDTLQTLLGNDIDSSKEKYTFSWNGKSQSIKLAQRPSLATLRPSISKSRDWNNTENLYFEGDNLEVIKLLQKTYYGRIKMIYIDPPYNTGNDFVYKDNYSDKVNSYIEQTNQQYDSNPESSGRYHSNWLNMMYPRLMLARNLLTEDGVLFISIDDNEVVNLRKICDEIMAPENFVAQITVIVKPEGRRYGAFAKTHEYLLVYAKRIEKLSLNEIEVEGAEYKYFDDLGGFNLKGLRNRNVQAFNSTNRPNLRYPFYVNESNPDSNGLFPVTPNPTDGFTKVEASIVDGLESVWRWGKEKATEQSGDLVAYRGNDGEIRIFQKERKLTQTPKTVWSGKDIISNKGTKEVQELLGKGVFDFPKPVELLKMIISIGTNDEDIILDFFSGSATTAHAVFEKNLEDKTHRRFILVQLPQKIENKTLSTSYETICDIGEERIIKAGNKVHELWLQKKDNEGLFAYDESFCVDIGFKVFVLDSSNINSWENTSVYDENTIYNSATVFKLDRSKEDILYEIMLKYGVFDQPVFEVNVNGKNLYRVGQRHMIVCLEDNIDNSDITEICKLSPRVVVFKEDGFKDDNAKINAEYNLKNAGVEDAKCI